MQLGAGGMQAGSRIAEVRAIGANAKLPDEEHPDEEHRRHELFHRGVRISDRVASGGEHIAGCTAQDRRRGEQGGLAQLGGAEDGRDRAQECAQRQRAAASRRASRR